MTTYRSNRDVLEFAYFYTVLLPYAVIRLGLMLVHCVALGSTPSDPTRRWWNRREGGGISGCLDPRWTPSGQMECDLKEYERAPDRERPADSSTSTRRVHEWATPAHAGASDAAIHASGLTKHYRHPWTLKVTRALTDLNLEVARGEVFGYLGPNGAGKTTTIKLLTGLLRPTSGAASLLGEPIGSESSRRRIGFLPEQPYFYDSLTGTEYLEFAAQLSGLGGQEASTRARHWMGRVGLGERPRLALRKYSKGMLQRVGLAAALIHDPELVILDEPMSGLDPFGRRDVRELILEQRERGVTVLLSSHILPDVEMLCDRVGVVLGGSLVRTATVNELVASQQQRVEVRCVGAPLIEVPARWRGRIERIELPEGTTFVLSDEREVNDLLAWLLGNGATLRAVTPQRASLEDFFLSVAESERESQDSRRTA